MMRRQFRRLTSPRGERGQALPVAIAALALGAILVTPLLLGASGGAQATGPWAEGRSSATAWTPESSGQGGA